MTLWLVRRIVRVDLLTSLVIKVDVGNALVFGVRWFESRHLVSFVSECNPEWVCDCVLFAPVDKIVVAP